MPIPTGWRSMGEVSIEKLKTCVNVPLTTYILKKTAGKFLGQRMRL